MCELPMVGDLMKTKLLSKSRAPVPVDQILEKFFLVLSRAGAPNQESSMFSLEYLSK